MPYVRRRDREVQCRQHMQRLQGQDEKVIKLSQDGNFNMAIQSFISEKSYLARLHQCADFETYKRELDRIYWIVSEETKKTLYPDYSMVRVVTATKQILQEATDWETYFTSLDHFPLNPENIEFTKALYKNLQTLKKSLEGLDAPAYLRPIF